MWYLQSEVVKTSMFCLSGVTTDNQVYNNSSVMNKLPPLTLTSYKKQQSHVSENGNVSNCIWKYCIYNVQKKKKIHFGWSLYTSIAFCSELCLSSLIWLKLLCGDVGCFDSKDETLWLTATFTMHCKKKFTEGFNEH